MGRIGELFEELVKEVAREFGKELAGHMARPEPTKAGAPHDQTGHLLRPKDAAQLLGKSVDWVRRRAADASLPHRKVGRDLRFTRRELEQWADKQR